MKKSIYIFAGVALSCMLMSCEDINEGGVDRHPQLPVKLKASITPFEQEKPETWKGEEEFGVFMFPSGEEKVLPPLNASVLKLTLKESCPLLKQERNSCIPRMPQKLTSFVSHRLKNQP